MRKLPIVIFAMLLASAGLVASCKSPTGGGGGTLNPPATAPAPTVAAGDGQLIVTWAVVDGAAQYEVRYGTGSDVSEATPLSLTDALTATIPGLTNGTPYNVWVRAKNSDGEGPWSNPVAGTPQAGASQTAPATAPAPAVSAGNGQLVVTWAAVPGATEYEVRYGTGSDVSAATPLAPTSALTATISGLANGTPCNVWVRAKNAVGYGPYNATAVTGTPDAAAVNLQSIAANITQMKTVYAKGEALDIAGLVVTGHYSNGTDAAIAGITAADITGYNAQTIGTQTLTIAYGGVSTTFQVEVNEGGAPAVTGISITGGSVVESGKTIALTAAATPAGADSRVTWSSGNTSRATVSAEGVVTGKGGGDVTITATSVANGNISATHTVTVVGSVLFSWEAANAGFTGNLANAAPGAVVNGVNWIRRGGTVEVKDNALPLAGARFTIGTAITTDTSASSAHADAQFDFSKKAKITITYTGTPDSVMVYVNNSTTSATSSVHGAGSRVYNATPSGGSFEAIIDPAALGAEEALKHSFLQIRTESGKTITITSIKIEYVPETEGAAPIISFGSLSDDSFTGFPAAQTISRSGATDSFTATLTGEYSSIAWYVNALAKGTGSSITINAADYAPGRYTLGVVVVKDAKPYSKDMAFTVTD